MFRDIDRKVLRILWNFSAVRRRLPTVKELSTKTGKHENEIRFILNKLQEGGFISWDGEDSQSTLIIKGWMDEQPRPAAANNSAFGKM